MEHVRSNKGCSQLVVWGSLSPSASGQLPWLVCQQLVRLGGERKRNTNFPPWVLKASQHFKVTFDMNKSWVAAAESSHKYLICRKKSLLLNCLAQALLSWMASWGFFTHLRTDSVWVCLFHGGAGPPFSCLDLLQLSSPRSEELQQQEWSPMFAALFQLTPAAFALWDLQWPCSWLL